MLTRQKLVERIETDAGQSLLAFQGTLIGIGVATGFVFWFFQGEGAFVNSVVYTMVIGNFTSLWMGILGRLIAATTPLWRWVQFLALLVPVGIVGGLLASLLIYLLPTVGHVRSLRHFLLQNMTIGLFVTLIVGVVLFSTRGTRQRLELANRVLQDQVQLGTMKLQGQAAELLSAHEIQAHLIPTNLPQIAGVQISGAWQPAQAVGGDYFDVLPFSPTRVAVCIADVSGKGMGAALLMANLQAAFRAFATEDTAPDVLCAKLNRALCSSIAPGKFVTFFYGILDTAYMLFDYGNAGHGQPILLRGETATSIGGGGMVLGLFPHAVYDEMTFKLQPGDCLLLTTDGITEAAHPDDLDDEFGETRLIACVQKVRDQGAHAIRSRILEEVTQFCAGQFQDDASLIVLTIDETTASA